MTKDLVFIAVDGMLTSSSAGHMRDLAKANAEVIMKRLNSMGFINKYISLIDGQGSKQTVVGYTKEQLENIGKDIDKVATYYSFEAWMNEAIEAKRRLFEELKNLSLEEWARIKEIELPQEPEYPDTMSEDGYLATLSIKERNRYFSLQSKVAAIGKLIHNDGSFITAMDEYRQALSTPIKTTLNGRDTILYESRPSVEETDVTDTYFKLQQKHREYQAQLNGMKELMNKAIYEDGIKKINEYIAKLSEYHNIIGEYQAQKLQYVKENSRELEKLKIVIPDHLREIFNRIFLCHNLNI